MRAEVLLCTTEKILINVTYKILRNATITTWLCILVCSHFSNVFDKPLEARHCYTQWPDKPLEARHSYTQWPDKPLEARHCYMQWPDKPLEARHSYTQWLGQRIGQRTGLACEGVSLSTTWEIKKENQDYALR